MVRSSHERKKSSGLKFVFVLVFALAILSVTTFAGTDVSAQTGSRIGSGSYPESVFWFGEPGEIKEVRELLNKGKVDEAIKVAEDFLAYLDTSGSVHGRHVLNRYFALNALCVALTASGRLDEALAECTSAIDLSAKRWQAFNSRGVIYYLVGRVDEALADYRAAVALVPRKSGPADIIRHNIELAEARKAGVSGR